MATCFSGRESHSSQRKPLGKKKGETGNCPLPHFSFFIPVLKPASPLFIPVLIHASTVQFTPKTCTLPVQVHSYAAEVAVS